MVRRCSLWYLILIQGNVFCGAWGMEIKTRGTPATTEPLGLWKQCLCSRLIVKHDSRFVHQISAPFLHVPLPLFTNSKSISSSINGKKTKWEFIVSNTTLWSSLRISILDILYMKALPCLLYNRCLTLKKCSDVPRLRKYPSKGDIRNKKNFYFIKNINSINNKLNSSYIKT